MQLLLRTAPPFVSVHTFCASQDGQRGSGFPKDGTYGILARFMTGREKHILARAVGIQKANKG